MKLSQTSIRNVCVAMIVLAHSACGPSQFNGKATAPKNASTEKSSGEKVSRGKNKDSASGEGFLQAGKSLDLYVIMDKSSSLFFVKDKNKQTVKGTDPDCKRFDALLDLIDSMRTKLVSKEKVRLTIVTFGTDPKLWKDSRFLIDGKERTENAVRTLEVTEDLLSESRVSIDQKYRAGVCEQNKEVQYTHYSAGIDKALSTKAGLVALKKYDVSSALFFSDGAANDVDENELRTAMDKLRQNFPKRLWGVILGDASTIGADGGLCTLKRADDTQMTAKDCMSVLVGYEADKLLQVESAAGLSAALTGLVGSK